MSRYRLTPAKLEAVGRGALVVVIALSLTFGSQYLLGVHFGSAGAPAAMAAYCVLVNAVRKWMQDEEPEVPPTQAGSGQPPDRLAAPPTPPGAPPAAPPV
jgi:hypothetical protein